METPRLLHPKIWGRDPHPPDWHLWYSNITRAVSFCFPTVLRKCLKIRLCPRDYLKSNFKMKTFILIFQFCWCCFVFWNSFCVVFQLILETYNFNWLTIVAFVVSFASYFVMTLVCCSMLWSVFFVFRLKVCFWLYNGGVFHGIVCMELECHSKG